MITSLDMPYDPSWVDLDYGAEPLWVVYDEAEGFQPACALVSAAHSSDACEVAEDVSMGRIMYDSETLVCRLTSITHTAMVTA